MTAPSQIPTRKARKPNLNETSKSAQVTKEMKKHFGAGSFSILHYFAPPPLRPNTSQSAQNKMQFRRIFVIFSFVGWVNGFEESCRPATICCDAEEDAIASTSAV